MSPCVRDPRKTEILGILECRLASWGDLFNSSGHSSALEHLLVRCGQEKGGEVCPSHT